MNMSLDLLDRILRLPPSRRRYRLLEPDTQRAISELGQDAGFEWLKRSICSPIGTEWTKIFLRLHPEWVQFEQWMRQSKEQCIVAIDALAELAPPPWDMNDANAKMPTGADANKIDIAIRNALEEFGNPRIEAAANKVLEAWPVNTSDELVLPLPNTARFDRHIPRLSKRDKQLLGRVHKGPWLEKSVSEALQLPYTFGSLIKLGVVRRLIHGELSDLVRAIAATIRKEWNSYASVRSRKRCGENLWRSCLYGLAINDWEYANRVATQMTTHTSTQHRESPELVMYDVLVALIENRYGAAEQSILDEHEKNWRTIAYFRRIGECLRVIGDREYSLFPVSIKNLCKTFRRNPDYPEDALICLEAHGIWRLANRIDPALIKEFDTCSDLPWDEALHAIVSEIDGPIAMLDYDSIHPRTVEDYRMLDPRLDFDAEQ